MKKIFLILFASLMLVSCSSTDKIERESHSFNYAGTLAPLEMSIWMYGTHTLTTENGSFYAVKSDAIDLNEYNNKSVEIQGNLIEGYPVDSGPEYLDVKAIKVMEN